MKTQWGLIEVASPLYKLGEDFNQFTNLHSVKARKNLLESAGLNERKDVIGPGQADTPPSGQTDQSDRLYYTQARTRARQHGGSYSS